MTESGPDGGRVADRQSRRARVFCARLGVMVAALALGGCVAAAGDSAPEATATQHWIRPPATASNLQTMPTAGRDATQTRIEPAAAQWNGNGAPDIQQNSLTPAATGPDASAPDTALGDSGTPPAAWAALQSIPPAGSANAALPSVAPTATPSAPSAVASVPSAAPRAAAAVAVPTPTSAPPAVQPPAPSAPTVAVVRAQPAAVTQVAAAASTASRPKTKVTPALAPGALALPSSIPPPQSGSWAAPAPVKTKVARTAKTSQGGYMPASRVIATVPKKIAAAPASKPVLTSRPVAVAAQPAAVQRPAVIVDYSVLSGLATMPAPAFVTTAAQPNGYVRQTGSVTIDYSVLQ